MLTARFKPPLVGKVLIALAVACFTATSFACPFCSAIKPTIAQQCDTAAAAFLGECTAIDTKQKPAKGEFAVQKVLQSAGARFDQKTLQIQPLANVKLGSLVLALGSGDSDATWNRLEWQIVPLNEVSFAYIARLPNSRATAAERLKYFAPFLEHADPLLAEDAFLEFGHAPYQDVLQAASFLPASKLRAWMNDPKILPERKGFYGLALGLTAQGEDRTANIVALEKLVKSETELGSDFRAGFDGILAGYLLATGGDGVDQIKSRFVLNSTAAEGDVRHVQSALRFYHEFGPAEDQPAVAKLVEHMLDRPGVAAAAIADLARWQQWTVLDRVAKLYPDGDHPDAALERAVVGFLRACPLPTAASALEALRQRDAEGVAAAEKALTLYNGGN
jgi:hypothetical protein